MRSRGLFGSFWGRGERAWFIHIVGEAAYLHHAASGGRCFCVGRLSFCLSLVFAMETTFAFVCIEAYPMSKPLDQREDLRGEGCFQQLLRESGRLFAGRPFNCERRSARSTGIGQHRPNPTLKRAKDRRPKPGWDGRASDSGASYSTGTGKKCIGTR